MAILNATGSAYPPLLNPGEPFAYLPPDVAYQLHIFHYVACATLGMFVWELLYDLPNIYKLFVHNRPSIPAVVYLISRLGTLLFLTLTVRVEIVGGNCAGLFHAFGVFWVLASSCTAMLFFFRVRALYRDNLVVVGFFSFLWICVLGGSLTVPIAGRHVSAHLLPNESFCTDSGPYPTYAGAAIIVPAVFDTLIFFAISYRLLPAYELGPNAGWREKLGLFFTGQGLPRLSKALLQGGQQYYLISVATNVFSLTFYFAPSVPAPYHVTVTLVLIAIINSMACKVYRDIKFGRIAGTTEASGNTRSAGILVPFRAAPQSRGNVFVNVDVSTTPDSSSGMRTGSSKMELSDTSFDRHIEMDGQP